MTGLEKMKSQILDEAKETAQTKISEAQAQADHILADARAEAEKSRDSISRKSDEDIAAHKERVESSEDLQRRTKLLEAKQQMISDVLDKAYESLQNMEPEAYFSMLEKLVEKYALPEAGELVLSPADAARMPAGFETRVAEIARGKGGSLTVAKETRKIDNGFVLVYGGIEENCTLEAIFDAERDDLSDIAQKILFP